MSKNGEIYSTLSTITRNSTKNTKMTSEIEGQKIDSIPICIPNLMTTLVQKKLYDKEKNKPRNIIILHLYCFYNNIFKI